jgi:hypothetical protein
MKVRIVNLPELESAAHGRGYLNDSRDSDGIVRSMPLVLSVKGALAPTVAVELLRVATRQASYTVRSDGQGIVGLQIGTSLIPTDRDGKLRLYYSPGHRRAARFGGGDPARSVGGERLGESGSDHRRIRGGYQRRGRDAAWGAHGWRRDSRSTDRKYSLRHAIDSPAVGALVGIVRLGRIRVILIVALPRRKPAVGVLLYCALGATLVIAASSLFRKLSRALRCDTARGGQRPRRRVALDRGLFGGAAAPPELDAELAVERNERLRAAGELRAAREIQMGMLPDPKAIDGLPANLDLHALLEPAQEIGGDLYDASCSMSGACFS